MSSPITFASIQLLVHIGRAKVQKERLSKVVTLRFLGYFGWQFLFLCIFGDVTYHFSCKVLAYLHDMAGIILYYVSRYY